MRISGYIDKIIYTNPENGYTVAQIETSEKTEYIVGIIPMIAEGEYIEVEGDYVTHNVYGRQFVVASFVSKLPVEKTSILRYLSSGVVKGIREKTARQIVDTFGLESLDVIENYPERLATIKGITSSRAKKIAQSMKENIGVKNILLYFQQYGITPAIAFKVFKQWGTTAYDLIKTNPYVICDIQGMTFDKVDVIAQRMTFDKNSPYRVRAGIKYTLQFNYYTNGHTFIPKDLLKNTTVGFLEIDNDLFDTVYDDMIAKEELVYVPKIGNCDGVYLDWVYKCEANIAKRMFFASKTKINYKGNFEKDIAYIQKKNDIEFSDLQKEAIKESIKNLVMILTGGPGTGKTTTLRGILELFEMKGISYAVAAPTGRAAKRITELTGREAKTIHRLLEYVKDDNQRGTFKRDRRYPLMYDALIIDESSMIDLELFNAFLEALPVTSFLILLGDVNQLPSVGPGCIFRDLIDSEIIKTIRLDHIFRQAEKSLIITNAHKIIKGEKPEIKIKNNDFFFIPAETTDEVNNTIVDLFSRRLPSAYGFEPLKDIQVICPAKKATTGTEALNELLRNGINPHNDGIEELKYHSVIFRQGDKVMQIRNNYDAVYEKDSGEIDAGIFNGDMGIIEKIYKIDDSMDVRFDDRVVHYTIDMLDDLTLAYAVTVHKSQGSEFPAVIIPIFDGSSLLYTRNLLYTAVTRAKKILIIVGNSSKLFYMVNNTKTSKRFSGLKSQIWSIKDSNIFKEIDDGV